MSYVVMKSLVRVFAGVQVILGMVGCSGPAEEDAVEAAEDRLLAGRRLPPAEIAALVRQAGFPERLVGTMICTAKWESSFYEEAVNRSNPNGSIDTGLFQVNTVNLGLRGCPSDVNELLDAATNTKCAFAIYKMLGLNAWYGYRKHKAECDSYPAPGRSAPAEPSDRCVGKNDGWYCSELDGAASFMCQNERIARSWQCADGTVCRSNTEGTATLSGSNPGCFRGAR